MPKIRVHIDGYGTVKVKRPKELTDDAVMDMVGEAVYKTLDLVWGTTDFHPAMGYLLKEDK